MTSGPIIPHPLADQWNAIMMRLEWYGNEGPDIEDARELLIWSKQRYGEDIEISIERLKTYIMKKLGAAFDPEIHCPYTGHLMHQFPMLSGPGNSEPLTTQHMGYWRENDGNLMRVRDLTESERFWIMANPDAFLKERAEFEGWLRPLQNKDI